MSERLAEESSSPIPLSSRPSVYRPTATKTLSQFPAARVAGPLNDDDVRERSWISSGPTSGRGQGRGVKLVSRAEWSHFLRALCHVNPVGEAHGAACALWALGEILRDLPVSERSVGTVALSEVNTRGEVFLGGGVRHVNARLAPESELVDELLSWLRAAAEGVEDPLEQAGSASGRSYQAGWDVINMDWVLQGTTSEPDRKLETLAQLCDWLRENLNISRGQRAEYIGDWARQHRRLAQSREGRLVEELGVALKRLSLGTQAAETSRFGLKTWLVVSAVLLALATALWQVLTR